MIMFVEICISLFLVIVIYNIVSYTKFCIDRKFNLKLYTSTTYKDVNSELDELIKDICIEYFYIHNIINQNYINDENQTNIIKDISEIVMKRISNFSYYRLSLFFDDIDDVIAMKIYVYINEYSYENNKPK